MVSRHGAVGSFTSRVPGSPDIRSADVCWSAPLHVVNASIAWPIRGGATRDSDPAQIEQRSERVDALKQDFDLISEREQLRLEGLTSVENALRTRPLHHQRRIKVSVQNEPLLLIATQS